MGERLQQIHERIRWARLQRADFRRPTDAARAIGVKPVTYRTWEEDRAEGGRVPGDANLKKIARAFGVSWVWLLTGEGTPDQKEDEIGDYVRRIVDKLAQVPGEKRADAERAVEGVLSAYLPKAS